MSTNKKNILDTCQRLPSAESLLPLDARVVEWQTRTFEGRMPKGLRVQVPPRALMLLPMEKACFNASARRFRTD
jgi:hypothetical protein